MSERSCRTNDRAAYVLYAQLAAALTFGACSAEVPSGRFACDGDRECPQSMSCQLTARGKRCVRGARADDAAIELRDASTTDAAITDGSAITVPDAASRVDASAALDAAVEGSDGSTADAAMDARTASGDAEVLMTAEAGSDGDANVAVESGNVEDATIQDSGRDAAMPFPTPCVRWIPHRAGPNDATIFAEYGLDWAAGPDVLPQRYCRAKVRDQEHLVPGKAIAKQGCYVISFNNGIEAVQVEEYELAVAEKGCRLMWRDLCEGSLPPGAAVIGVDENRKPFYSCNIVIDHEQHAYAGSHIGVVGDYTSGACMVAFPPFGHRDDVNFAVMAAVSEAEFMNPDYCRARSDGGAGE